MYAEPVLVSRAIGASHGPDGMEVASGVSRLMHRLGHARERPSSW
jgi:hypothetical protein